MRFQSIQLETKQPQHQISRLLHSPKALSQPFPQQKPQRRDTLRPAPLHSCEYFTGLEPLHIPRVPRQREVACFGCISLVAAAFSLRSCPTHSQRALLLHKAARRRLGRWKRALALGRADYSGAGGLCCLFTRWAHVHLHAAPATHPAAKGDLITSPSLTRLRWMWRTDKARESDPFY